MKQISKKIISFILAFVMVLGLLPISKTSVAKAEGGKVVEDKKVETQPSNKLHPLLEGKLPLFAGYYRTWHDVTSQGDKDGQKVSNEGKIIMSEIPKEVGLVFVFDGWQHKDSDFYKTLKDKYVPEMHAKNQLVVRTIGTEYLFGANGPAKETPDLYFKNGEKGYEELAKKIVQEYVLNYGLDGLDLDVEKHNYSFVDSFYDIETREEILKRIDNVYKYIVKELKAHNKLVIYDTTIGPEWPVFKDNAKNIDLVLVQRYGNDGEVGGWDPAANKRYNTLVELFENFGKYITPNKIMIGASFYEENSEHSNRWYDIPMSDGTVENDKYKKISGNLLTSRIGRYINKQYPGGVKAGVFAYAIERDGVKHPTKDRVITSQGQKTTLPTESDVKLPSEFNWSKELYNAQKNHPYYQKFTVADFGYDEALFNEIVEKVGPFKGDLQLFNKDLELTSSKIEKLTGLKQLEKVNKITLNGLTSLKEVNKSDLPEHIKGDDKLEIKGLTNLEKLDLSEFDLEILPFSADESKTWSKLKYFDVSNNNIDFTPGTKNRDVLNALNYASLNEENFKINLQRPKSYAQESFGETIVKKNLKEKYDLREKLTGWITKSGYLVLDESGFEEFKSYKFKHPKSKNNIQFVDEKFNFENFKSSVNYNEYSVEVYDHAQTKVEKIEENHISSDKDETFTINYINQEGRKIYTFNVVYGNGLETLTLIKPDNNKIYSDNYRNHEVNVRAFDDKVSTDNDFIANKPSEKYPVYLAFELEDGVSLSSWTLIQQSTHNILGKDSNVIAELQYLADDSFNLNDKDTLEQKYDKIYKIPKEKWITVSTVDDPSKDKFIGNFKSQTHKYWRVNITDVVGKESYIYSRISEIKLFGTKLDKSSLQKAIDDANTYINDVKVREQYSQESIKKLTEARDKAEELLNGSGLTKEKLDEKLEDLNAAILEVASSNLEVKVVEEKDLEDLYTKALEEFNKKEAEEKKIKEEAEAEEKKIKTEKEAEEKRLKEEREALDKKVKELEAKKQAQDQKVKELEAEKEANAKEISDLKSEVEKLKAEAKKVKEELAAKEKEAAEKSKELEAQIQKLAKEKQDAEKAKQDAEKAKQDAEEKLNGKVKELEDKLKANSNAGKVETPLVPLTPATKVTPKPVPAPRTDETRPSTSGNTSSSVVIPGTSISDIFNGSTAKPVPSTPVKPNTEEVKPETEEYKLVVQDINKKLEEVSKDLYDILSGEYKGGFESEIKEIGFVNKAGEKVTKFDRLMDVSLELKSLKLTDKDTLRVFHIGENGVDEVKDVKVDGQKVMFKSATFSPFVFVKGEKKAEAGNTGSAIGTPAQGSQQNTDTQVQSTGTTNPETGDNGIMTYAIMAVVAVVALGGMVVVKKRAKNN